MRDRGREPWYESSNPTTVVRGGTWRAGIWLLAVVAIALTIGGIVWGIQVLTAEPKGRGDAYRQKESANNRVFAQELFEKQHADVQATKAKIAAAGKVRESSPEAEIRYQGLVQYCMSVAAEYNAAARSYRTEQFRAADLPAQLDPSTECEPKP